MQNFKGDAVELKFQAVPTTILDVIKQSLDEFYANGEDCDSFLLSLYDSERLSFSNRIGREYFLDFFRELLSRAPFTGSFEGILYVLWAIFGTDTGVSFTVPGPGQLEIDIEVYSDIFFDAIVRQLESGSLVEYSLATSAGDDLVFRGIPGIETEAELLSVFLEMIGAGIHIVTSVGFFTRYSFVTEEGSEFFVMVDHLGNELIFVEVGE